MTDTIDTTEIDKSTLEVKEYWANKVGEWAQWADPMAKLAKGMNTPLLNALNIQPADYVLDLASGVGEPAFSEAQQSGTDGLTIATDIVPAMLSALQKREGSHILSFTAADMQALPFADNSFNHVSCRFGLMFVPNQPQSVAECYRVLKPAGKLAYLLWGPKQDQRIFNIIEDSLKKLFDIKTDHDFGRIFSLNAEGLVSGWMREAGFSILQDEAIHFAPVAPEGIKFWTSQLDMSFGHLIKELTPDQRVKLDQEIEHRLQAFKTEQGGYQLSLSVRLVCGEKQP